MPPGGTFTGVWFSPQYGELHMVQTKTQIVGEFKREMRHGRVYGEAQGDLFIFRWEEEREVIPGHPITNKGRGYFKYKIDERGDHFIVGQWGLKENLSGGGPWNAVKSRTKQPSLSLGKPKKSDDEYEYSISEDE